MLVFIWAALLFCVSANTGHTGNQNQTSSLEAGPSTIDSTINNSAGETVSQNVTDFNMTAITTMAKSVGSTTMYTAQALSNTTDGPVGGNDTKENVKKPTDLLTELLTIVKQPQVIIAFFIGVLLSAIICCLITKCNRKKQRGSRKTAESLEMVTTQVVPLMHDGQAVNDGDDGTHGPEAADGGAGAVEPKEVEYSNIDFSALKRRSPTEAEETPDPTETEYAEIKKDAPVEGQDNAGEESEAMEGNKEEGAMTGEGKNEKEPEQCEPAKDEGGEDVAVYSNVYEVMDET